MKTKEIVQNLVSIIRRECPGIDLDYSVNQLEYELYKELDDVLHHFVVNDNQQEMS